MIEINVTMRGNVVSDPRHIQLRDGTAATSFRLACTPRRWDRDRNEWISRETLWVTVNCWRSLATNVAAAIRKGQPVVVVGRLTERSWTTDERSGRTLEIEAETVGHDLVMGTADFDRTVRTDRAVTELRAYEPADPNGDGEPVPQAPAAGEGFPGLVVLDGEVGGEPSGTSTAAPGEKATASGRGRAKAAVS